MKSRKLVLFLLGAGAVGAIYANPTALEGDAEKGRVVYKVCTSCHGPEAWGSADGLFPQLAGQYRSVIIRQIKDIRDGNRDNPTMYPFSQTEALGGEQALADVAAYIEGLPMNPDHGKGEWEPGTPEFEQGKALYKRDCAHCHGEQGEGNAADGVPLLQGQHYQYMLRQFEWIRDGRRRNANPGMVSQITKFSDSAMKQVVNYVSRFPVARDKLEPGASSQAGMGR